MSGNNNPSQQKSSIEEEARVTGFMDEQKPKEFKYISRGNHRVFLIVSSFFVFLSHTPFLIMFIFYMAKGYDTNKYINTYFIGSLNVYFSYAIICTVFYFIIMIAASIIPTVGRKGFQYPLFIFIWFSTLYLTVWGFWKESQGRYMFESDMTMIFFATAFYGSSFGLFITAIFSQKGIKREIGLGIAVGSQILVMLLLYFYRQMTSPKYYVYLLHLMWVSGLSLYYTKDLELMVRKRSTFYRTDDWFLGMVHLQTDLFFRFWWDLFFSRKLVNDVTQPIAEVKNEDLGENFESEMQRNEPNASKLLADLKKSEIIVKEA